MWDKAMVFMSGVAAAPLIWIGASVMDVWMHNTTDFVYAAWNIFTLFH